MRCEACGKEISDGARFCRFCGAKIEPPKPEKRFCAQCGAELGESAKFCKKCGAPAASAGEPDGAVLTIPVDGPVLSVSITDAPPAAAAAAAAGVTIPVTEPVESITVSDAPPVKAPEAKKAKKAESKPAKKADAGQGGKSAAKSAVKPQKTASPMSTSARKAAESVLREVIARLTDGDFDAPASAGEMTLPVTEAQSDFLKLISKGL